jgi:hypothetical protein
MLFCNAWLIGHCFLIFRFSDNNFVRIFFGQETLCFCMIFDIEII